MESYLFLDASCFYPFLYWLIDPRRSLKAFEYELVWFSWFTADEICLVGYGHIFNTTSFLLVEVDTIVFTLLR